jgi:hypothetical protein
VTWKTSDHPSYLQITPILSLEDNETVVGYIINPSRNGTGRYSVIKYGDRIDFIVDGVRYFADLKTGDISRLVFKDMPVTTIDFSTNNGYSNILDTMFINIRQSIMNKVV